MARRGDEEKNRAFIEENFLNFLKWDIPGWAQAKFSSLNKSKYPKKNLNQQSAVRVSAFFSASFHMYIFHLSFYITYIILCNCPCSSESLVGNCLPPAKGRKTVNGKESQLRL